MNAQIIGILSEDQRGFPCNAYRGAYEATCVCRFSCLNRADLVRIHDGNDLAYPTIAVLCNEDSEIEVLSTGPDLLVNFVANSKWPGQGFKATYQFVQLDDHIVGKCINVFFFLQLRTLP